MQGKRENVHDKDEKGKCTVRVGFLAVSVAVKLQYPRTLWGLRPWTPPGLCPGPAGVFTALPRSPARISSDLWSLHVGNYTYTGIKTA